MHFIKKILKKGMKFLNAGGGTGRYSIEFANRGCQVTLFDISDEQLKIAKEKINEAKVNENIEGIFQVDIRDLSQFKNEEFDMVVCYGVPCLMHLKIEIKQYLNLIGYFVNQK